MAAHLVVPFQQKQQKQEHVVEHEQNGWVGAAPQPQAIAGGGWPMAWRSHQGAGAVRAAAGSDDSSWEVRAFAEDAASCSEQWPPRSYSCSFCAREFRTAQALGGHMNVHRRERAYANQLGLLRSSNSSASVSLGDASCSSTSAAPTPALGVCWLYPVPASSGSNLLCHQQVSSTVTTTTTTGVTSTSRQQQTETRKQFGAFHPSEPALSMDPKRMMQDHADPNVDLELRLGQAL